MIVKKCIIEFNDLSDEDLEELKKCLAGIEKRKRYSTGNSQHNGDILKKFKSELTDKQMEIFDLFEKKPGPMYSYEIKSELPKFKPHGALSGTLRGGRKKWISLGGDEKDSPFYQIDWDRKHCCGKYRGLTSAEIDYLQKNL